MPLRRVAPHGEADTAVTAQSAELGTAWIFIGMPSTSAAVIIPARRLCAENSPGSTPVRGITRLTNQLLSRAAVRGGLAPIWEVTVSPPIVGFFDEQVHL